MWHHLKLLAIKSAQYCVESTMHTVMVGGMYIYIYMCGGNPQPGIALTDLSTARAWGQSYMHSLQDDAKS